MQTGVGGPSPVISTGAEDVCLTESSPYYQMKRLSNNYLKNNNNDKHMLMIYVWNLQKYRKLIYSE